MTEEQKRPEAERLTEAVSVLETQLRSIAHDLAELHRRIREGHLSDLADAQRRTAEIRQWLNKFGQDSVPLYVFIPGGQPSKTKVLRETINQDDVLKVLEETLADSSRTSKNASTALTPTKTEVSYR